MSQFYLVAFKEENNGKNSEVNHALRELLDERRSYCTPVSKAEVFGPNTPRCKLAEICWLPALIAGKRLMNHVRPTRKSRDMNCWSGLITLKMIKISFSQGVGDMKDRNEKRVGCFNG